MADFDLIIYSAATTTAWLDPEVSGKPSRLNPRPRMPHRFKEIDEADALELRALVDGALKTDAQMAALSRGTFVWSWVDRPGATMPTITPTVGTSAQLQFAAGAFSGLKGHYTILCQELGSGSIGISWEVT